MRVDRVLDREFVQLELPRHRVELLRGRLVEADPDEGVGAARGLERLLEREAADAPVPSLVDGAVDDHAGIITRVRPPPMRRPIGGRARLRARRCGSCARSSPSSSSPCSRSLPPAERRDFPKRRRASLPGDNPWNPRVDTLPVAANSVAIVNSIGATGHLHPDFGSGLWKGARSGSRTRSSAEEDARHGHVRLRDRERPGPYPIPTNVKIEGGSDRARAACRPRRLQALRALRAAADPSGAWTPARARSGISTRTRCGRGLDVGGRGRPADPPRPRALRRGRRRPDRPRAPLHRLTTRRAYVWPARHFASSLTDPYLPPMGLRFRLKAGYDISGFPPQARVVLGR